MAGTPTCTLLAGILRNADMAEPGDGGGWVGELAGKAGMNAWPTGTTALPPSDGADDGGMHTVEAATATAALPGALCITVIGRCWARGEAAAASNAVVPTCCGDAVLTCCPAWATWVACCGRAYTA